MTTPVFPTSATPAVPKTISSPALVACLFCPRTFQTRKSLHQHGVARHGGSKTKPFKCGICTRVFKTGDGVVAHCAAVHLCSKSKQLQPPIVHTCATCKKQFCDPTSLQAHKRNTDHCFCKDCNILFSTEERFIRHKHVVMHASEFWCCDCSLGFKTETALLSHLEAEIHTKMACQLCPSTFGSWKTLDIHIVAIHHVRFITKRKIFSPQEHACYACQRRFCNDTALKNHLESLYHKPLSDLRCIASPKCNRRFTSPSALLDHLESGRCRSKINRQDINNLVLAHDTECIIISGDDSSIEQYSSSTFPSSLPLRPDLIPTSSTFTNPSLAPLSANDDAACPKNDGFLEDLNVSNGVSLVSPIRHRAEHMSDPFQEDLTISDQVSLRSSVSPTFCKVESDGNSFLQDLTTSNGVSLARYIPVSPRTLNPATARRSSISIAPQKEAPFACHLCPSYRQPFSTQIALQQHLASPTHAPKMFHCPTNIDHPATERMITKHFKSLSGLMRHIESGSCGDGRATLKMAMDLVQVKLENLGLGGVRLLPES